MGSIQISEDDLDIMVNEGEEQTPCSRDRESTTSSATTSTNICQSPLICICSIVITMILILPIYIGWRYSDACPINPLISCYLIVAGIGSLALALFFFLTPIMTQIFTNKMSSDATNQTKMFLGHGIRAIICVSLLLFLFLLGWTVIGWIWVLLVWQRVQYRRAGVENYCHSLLYQFSFSFLMFTTTFKLAFLCCIRRKIYNRIIPRQRRDTSTSNEG